MSDTDHSDSDTQKHPFRVKEIHIGFLERLGISIQVIITTIMIVITAILMLPIHFISALFTTKRRVVEVMMQRPMPGPDGHSRNPDDGEDWKQAHNEQYGED